MTSDAEDFRAFHADLDRREIEWRRKIRRLHEDMFVRMLGKRDVIDRKSDPDRLKAILDEWFR
jgi:hypothetical protein